jgi:hypothetical protein
MASLLWLYYKVDYLILLRKREGSLKALALLLVVYGSVVLCFFRVSQLIHNTFFIATEGAFMIGDFNYLVILFSRSYNYSLHIAHDVFASSSYSIIYEHCSL